MSAVAESEKICVVCQNNIQDPPACEEETETILKCKHIFHRGCCKI